MPTTAADRVPARVRGGGVGTVSAVLAVAAHTMAGGALPGPAGVAAVGLLGAALGAAAATVPGLRRGAPGVLGALALAQLLGHGVLERLATGHQPGMAGMPGMDHGSAAAGAGPGMLAGHALATLVCGVLVLRAEDVTRVAGVLAAALPSLAPAPVAAPLPVVPHPVLPVLDRVAVTLPPEAHPVRGTGRRGPPARRPVTT